MTLPLYQLSFREPEPGLWVCKKETFFFLDQGGICIVKIGQPIVVVNRHYIDQKILWRIVLPNGQTCLCDWQFQVDGRWSKRFFLEQG